VAVWLAAEDGDFQLGAYMKYTVPGEQMLTDALKRVLLPRVAAEAVFRCRGEDLAAKLTPQEGSYLKGQDVLAVNCTYLGESLAALVFFRDAKGPFDDEDESLLKQVSPIFAVTLASIVRGTDEDADAGHAGEDGNNPFFDGAEGREGKGGKDDTSKKKPKEKKDAADWWKRGEDPPF
jgi:hypothetical protein